MRVLVTGGRNFLDRPAVYAALDEVKDGLECVIVGDATGADNFAWSWCVQNQIPCRRFWADWLTHGKAAGPIRNQQMLVEGKPDLVLAFPGGRGTEDMVRRAERAGVEVKRPMSAQEKPTPGARKGGEAPKV